MKRSSINVGINGYLPVVYVRQGVAKSLLEFLDNLPKDLGIIAYDGYRPIEVQEYFFERQYQIEKAKPKNKNRTHDELVEIVKDFVSIPSRDVTKPSTHNTGGALDFALCDDTGKALDFGDLFDGFGKASRLEYFEERLRRGEHLDNNEREILLNRRILFNNAKQVGLEGYKHEWWHYDMGNQWDGKLSTAKYGSCDTPRLAPSKNSMSIKDL